MSFPELSHSHSLTSLYAHREEPSLTSSAFLYSHMQDNPNALDPWTPDAAYSAPTFEECYTATCYKTFGLRIFNSTYVYMYGGGSYSSFNNYDQGCLVTEKCQELMVSLEQSEAVYSYGLSTKAAQNQVEVDMVALVPTVANPNGFCQTVCYV